MKNKSENKICKHLIMNYKFIFYTEFNENKTK